MGVEFFFPLGPLCNSYDCIPSIIHSLATGCATFVLIILSLPCLPHSADFPPFPSPAQPSVLLGEDPPPYSPLTSPESGSAPVISCRVCQSPISVEGKIHQHVVKCAVCNEATVGSWRNLYCLGMHWFTSLIWIFAKLMWLTGHRCIGKFTDISGW